MERLGTSRLTKGHDGGDDECQQNRSHDQNPQSVYGPMLQRLDRSERLAQPPSGLRQAQIIYESHPDDVSLPRG